MFRFSMRREPAALTALLLASAFACASARADASCAQIADGAIYDDDGVMLTVGTNRWGYDYVEHTYVGGYCGSTHDAPSCEPYRDVELAMVWNDAWLSNADCNHDGLLDRHDGFPSYRGSGAELVNALHGRFQGNQGQMCDWYQVQRFVAAPTDARRQGANWVGSDGTVLGQAIWTDFYVILSEYNYVCLADEAS